MDDPSVPMLMDGLVYYWLTSVDSWLASCDIDVLIALICVWSSLFSWLRASNFEDRPEIMLSIAELSVFGVSAWLPLWMLTSNLVFFTFESAVMTRSWLLESVLGWFTTCCVWFICWSLLLGANLCGHFSDAWAPMHIPHSYSAWLAVQLLTVCRVDRQKPHLLVSHCFRWWFVEKQLWQYDCFST